MRRHPPRLLAPRHATRRRTRALVGLAVLLPALLLPAPAAAVRPHKRAFREGDAAAARGDWDWAVLHYQRALDLRPQSLEYRNSLAQARVQASYQHFELAKRHLAVGNLEAAIMELQQTVQLNPAHQYAYVELEKALTDWREQQATAVEGTEIERMKREADEAVGEVPKLDPRSNIPIQFDLEDKTVQEIFRVIQDVSNINVIFDEGVRLDERTSFVTDNVSLEEALDLLMLQLGLAYKVYNESTILVYQDNQTKQREYEDQVIRTFYLSNADVKEVNALLRGVIEVRKTAVNESLNAITIRDSQDAIAIAGRIIEANDKAKAELVIDLEILEVNRSRLATYGIDLRSNAAASGLTQSIGFDDTQVRLNNLRRLNQLGSWILSPIPSLVISLVRNDADTRVLSRPQVRVTDGERVTVHLGDQVPIPNTTFNSSQTVGGNIVPITSFTYQNVGIQIQLEPRIHHNREITVKMQAEISSVTSVNQGGQPTIGTREVDTVIRLRDGETSLLAGLFQETDSNSRAGVPGLMDIPGLRRVFGSTNRNDAETEIVLTVTPHIIRIPDISASDLAPLFVGTQRRTRLRGQSQHGVGGSPFASPEETTAPEDLFTSLRPGAEVRDRGTLTVPDLDLASGLATGTTRAAPTAGVPAGTPVPAPGGSAPPAPAPVPAPRPLAPAPPPGGPAPGGAAGPAAPTGSVEIGLVPDAASVRVGQTFRVTVSVDANGHPVAHAPYHVLHDPSLAEVVSVDEGGFFRSAGINTVWLPNVQPGRVIVGHSQFGRGETPTGSGTLALLTLRALAAGTLDLRFEGLTPRDPINDPLPVRSQDARVTIQP